MWSTSCMTSSQSGPKRLGAALAAIGLAYPFLVYFGTQLLPPIAMVIALLAFIVLRSAGIGGSPAQRPLIVVSAVVGLVVLGIAMRAPLISLKAYPILLSIGLAALFSHSLLRPPTVMEQIAGLSQPNLDAAAISYLRKLTLVWLCFFILNAAISAATAFWASLETWTLYNGLISYLLIGCIFTGEFAVRHFVRHGRRVTE
jgi:uncharacterized membrane protein